MITAEQITMLVDRDDWHGWGYLGSPDRKPAFHDGVLAKAANRIGLDLEDVFLWANSTYGRHFMDNAPSRIKAFADELEEALPLLRSHNLAYNARTSLGLAARRRIETRIRMLRAEASRLERALEGHRW